MDRVYSDVRRNRDRVRSCRPRQGAATAGLGIEAEHSRGVDADGKAFVSSVREAMRTSIVCTRLPRGRDRPRFCPWGGGRCMVSKTRSERLIVPNEGWKTSWKRYRGGATNTPNYIGRPRRPDAEQVPERIRTTGIRCGSGPSYISFRPQRGGDPLRLTTPRRKTVKQSSKHRVDLKSLRRADALVYEQFARIYLLDPARANHERVKHSNTLADPPARGRI